MRAQALVRVAQIHNVELWIWAPVDPLSLGNKRYKLQPAVAQAKHRGSTAILSFGGAFSNHLHALSILCKEHGIGSIGVVRGEVDSRTNATLSDVQKNGMALEFVTRIEYRRRADPDWLEMWQQKFPDALLLAEGGSSPAAVTACEQLLDECPSEALDEMDVIACACGTGATVAGLARRYQSTHVIKAYDVVGDLSTRERIHQWGGSIAFQSEVVGTESVAERGAFPFVDATFGGYAVANAMVYEAIERVFVDSGVLLDPIYTAKVWLQLAFEAQQGVYAKGTRVLMVHTGGLQGWRGKWQEAKGHLPNDVLLAMGQRLRQQGLVLPLLA